MDNWPRIPTSGQSASSSRTSGASLPPAGSVVMASVEEDLGEGMYALKWNGNRIAVTSQAVLRPGQSLILKSERSPDGKVSLVVQGPALSNPGDMIGRPVYGPSEKRPAQEANQQAQSGEMAASVGKPAAAQSGQPAASLLGLVLEPVDELTGKVQFLIDEAALEKEEWQKHFDQKKASADNQPAQSANKTDGEVADPANPAKTPASPEQSDKPAAQPQPPPDQAAQAKPTQPVEQPPASTQPAQPQVPADGARPLPADPAVQPQPTTRPAELPPQATVNPPVDSSQPLPAPPPSPGTIVPEMPAVPPQAGGGAPPAAATPPPVQPEIALKETLIQLIKTAELPLTNNDLQNLALSVGQKVPEAIADKAAGILLRASGLTPDAVTMEAARALVDASVQVDRPTVQAMLALAANVPEEERATVLKAVARQAAKDIPLTAPLASGLADVLARKDSAFALLGKAVATLSSESIAPEIRPLADTAVEMLDLLSVDLEGDDAALALERYISTFGRTALGKATALVETAAQTILENHPVLPKIDASLTALLTLLESEMAAEVMPVQPQQQQAQAKPADAAQPPVQEKPVQPQPEQSAQPTQPVLPKPETPAPDIRPMHTNPYATVAKLIPPLESLNLPPMPKVATLPAGAMPSLPAAPMPQPAQPLAPEQPQPPVPGAAADGEQVAQPQPQPLPSGQTPVQPQPQPQPGIPVAPDNQPQPPATAAPAAPQPGTGQQPAPSTQPPEVVEPNKQLTPEQAKAIADAIQEEARQRFTQRLDPYLTPGGNRPEIELLKPNGFLDRFLADGTGQDTRITREAERLIKDLLSDDPAKREQALRDLPTREKAILHEAASRLSRMEQQLLRADAQLSRLSDTSGTLRDLGRQLLAVKAENVAGQDRNPQVMLAEVPFKLNDNGGDGRMQMFYRRSKGKNDSWTSRVILDLNTTILGPVLGDMRFFASDMVLNMFVDKQETADFLAKSADILAENLLGKGFRLKSRFMVLPPPPPPPQITAERPEIKDEPAAPELPASTRRLGRLDTKA